MRLSTVFVSSVMLAGMTTTLAVERENMLVARFVDSDFLASVEARAYDEELELHAWGVARRSYSVSNDVARRNVISKDGSRGGDKDGRPPKYKIAKDDPSPQYYELTHPRDKNWSAETDSLRNHNRPNGKSGLRRPLSKPPLHELTRRRRYHPSVTGADRARGDRAYNRTVVQGPVVHATTFHPPPHRIIL